MTTRTRNRPTHEGIDPAPVRHRIELSVTQLVASAFAAVTTTVAASFLGVAGTVAGAAIASVLTVTGNAVYGFSLRRTHDRVRGVVPPAARRSVNDPRPRPTPTGARCDHAPLLPSSRPRGRAERDAAARRSPWRALTLASIVLFTGVLAVVTTVEVVAGRPLTDVLRGDSGSGTTLFGGGTGGVGTPTTPQPVPTVTQTVTPSVRVVTPTVTQTAPARTVTTTPTATATSTPSPATSDSGATSGSGAPTTSPSTSAPAAPLP